MLRCALIGYGEMGKRHAELLSWLPQTNLVAICDVRPASLTAARIDYPAVTTYTSVSMLLEAERPELVVIATHADYHAAPALLAAEYGAHVVCEKPIASSLEEADEMVDTFASKGLLLVVNHQWRISPAVNHAADLLLSGSIGKLVALHINFGKGRPAGYELAELGTHAFDIANRFAGQPSSCQAFVVHDNAPAKAWNVREGAEMVAGGRECGLVVGTAISASFKYHGGQILVAEGYSSGQSSDRDRLSVELRGTRARLRLTGGDFSKIEVSEGVYPPIGAASLAWKQLTLPENKAPAGLSPYASSMLPLYEHLFISVETDTPHPCNGANARVALEMVSAVYRSHFADAAVALPLTDRGDFLRALSTSPKPTESEV